MQPAAERLPGAGLNALLQFQAPIKARPAERNLPSDLARSHPVLLQLTYLTGLGYGGRLATLVSALGLRLGDTLAVALQHYFALELGDGADDIEHHAA